MNPEIFISICIPAYKRPDQMQRLLNSIAIQTYKEFEVVISDDSPDASISNLLNQYTSLPIRYYHNPKPLGTPSNWNHCISLAKGEWIKLMHDDDWFSGSTSLEKFAVAAKKGDKFIFSRYLNVFASGKMEKPDMPSLWKKKIVTNPMMLLARNIIGPPSVIMVHRSAQEDYDTRLKWRVDMEFYIRLLTRNKSFCLIDEVLVCVGISETQVTNDCINVPEVELPEGLTLLKKYGTSALKNFFVYDAWWRILRNTGIRSTSQLNAYTPKSSWPKAILQMVDHQKQIPGNLLRFGPFSKMFMIISYLRNYKNL